MHQIFLAIQAVVLCGMISAAIVIILTYYPQLGILWGNGLQGVRDRETTQARTYYDKSHNTSCIILVNNIQCFVQVFTSFSRLGKVNTAILKDILSLIDERGVCVWRLC